MVVMVVRLVTIVVIMETWLEIALKKAAALVGSMTTDTIIVERKSTLLENALILPQRDEKKRGVIVYMLFSLRIKGYFAQGYFNSASNLFFPLSLFSSFGC